MVADLPFSLSIKMKLLRHHLITFGQSWCKEPGGIVIIGFALYLLVYFSWYFANGATTPENLIIADWLYLLPPFMAVVFAARAARSPALDRRTRRAWLIITCAFAATAIGEVYSVAIEIRTGDIPPFPSFADVLFISFYPCMLLGLLSFPFLRHNRAERARLWLDVAVVMVSMGMLVWYILLQPLASASYPGTLEVILTISYPVGDLALLFGITVVLLNRPPPDSRGALLILVTGLAILDIADIIYVYQQIHNEYEAANWLDTAWTLVFFLEALSAQYQVWRATHSNEHTPIQSRRSFSMLPYAGILFGYGLVVDVIGKNWTQPLAKLMLGAVALTALIVTRQIIAMRENERLRAEVIRSNELLLTLSLTDSLTGVANRRAFEARLQDELHYTYRYGTPLSLILLDVDNFKSYNDVYGHLDGDRVLRDVGQLLQQQARAADVVARHGGEEFVVLLPNTDAAEAVVVAERMRAVIAAHEWPHRAITASFGVTTVTGQHASGYTLQSEADRALYHVKAVGRNGVYHYAWNQAPKLEA